MGSGTQPNRLECSRRGAAQCTVAAVAPREAVRSCGYVCVFDLQQTVTACTCVHAQRGARGVRLALRRRGGCTASPRRRVMQTRISTSAGCTIKARAGRRTLRRRGGCGASPRHRAMQARSTASAGCTTEARDRSCCVAGSVSHFSPVGVVYAEHRISRVFSLGSHTTTQDLTQSPRHRLQNPHGTRGAARRGRGSVSLLVRPRFTLLYFTLGTDLSRACTSHTAPGAVRLRSTQHTPRRPAPKTLRHAERRRRRRDKLSGVRVRVRFA